MEWKQKLSAQQLKIIVSLLGEEDTITFDLEIVDSYIWNINLKLTVVVYFLRNLFDYCLYKEILKLLFFFLRILFDYYLHCMVRIVSSLYQVYTCTSLTQFSFTILPHWLYIYTCRNSCMWMKCIHKDLVSYISHLILTVLWWIDFIGRITEIDIYMYV